MQPFKIEIDEVLLVDLKRRLDATRLPAVGRLDGWSDDWDDGTAPRYLHELVNYWRTGFEWRVQEAGLNRFNHLRGEIDSTMLHVIHERGCGPKPLPILLTHGYLDSFWRFTKLIPLLTDPEAHDGDPEDAFNVVVPSLPGYAFSEARPQVGGASSGSLLNWY